MIWLSTVSLVTGGLLARHFKIIALAPATFVVVAIATAVGELQSNDIRSIVSTIAIATAGTQIGYFLAMLFQYALSSPSLRNPSPSSHTGQPPSISRTPIS